MGALRTLDVPDASLCAPPNVDRAKLVAYVRVAVAEFTDLQHSSARVSKGS